MPKITDAQDAELLDATRRSSATSTTRTVKKQASQTDADIIDITDVTELEDGAAPSSAAKKNNGKISKKKSAVSGDAVSEPLAESPEAEEEESPELLDAEFDIPAHDAEIVEDSTFDDGFASLDDDVIDLDSSLPAVTGPRLPSINLRDNLQSYLREVSRFPLLDPEEETALARRVRDHGDSEAAFRIISSHLRLVVRIAMDFQRRWMQNVLDLIQEGNVGLLRAVNKFDPDKGIKFSYYASFWIKAYILKFIMDNWRMVKIGTTQAQRKLFYNLNRERQKLILQGFDPDSALLSQRLGVTQDQVIEMQQRLDAGDVSLDVPVNDENGSTSRMDFLPALGPGIEDDIAGSEISRLVRDSIEGLLPSLSEKEIYILENRLLTDEPATLREIGERYNVTRERIRQLEARLLEKLKEHLGREIGDFSEDWINQ
ncbi:MAG: RNA polymerase factor sigma-32 [Mailhella sp.]|nr:RNA polymerase factor sigma-32 [Mailhella sp.]